MSAGTGTRNGSHAAVAQRRAPRGGRDYWPTPLWVTRALTGWLQEQTAGVHRRTVWEPACGLGAMARPLAEAWGKVRATDAHDYGVAHSGWRSDGVEDFLAPRAVEEPQADWIVTNPPFGGLDLFARLALGRASHGVALLMPVQRFQGSGRHAALWAPHPPTDVLVFAERCQLVPGRLDPRGDHPLVLAWVVWNKGVDRDRGPRLHWLPPGTRARFERPGDWDDDCAWPLPVVMAS